MKKNVPFRLIGQKASQRGSNVRRVYETGKEKGKPPYGQGYGDSA
jgi:hypothetical protein